MMMNKTRILFIAVSILTSLLFGNSAIAATWVVDSNGFEDYTSIQEAIDADTTSEGDTIIINPGIYLEHINLHGSKITITSTEPNDPNIVGTTIIDGNGSGNVVTFNNGESQATILQGLTITNGQNGIQCTGINTSPLISKCRVIANKAVGISCSSAKPTVTQCTIQNNLTSGISGCLGQISFSQIRGNGSGAFTGNAGLVNCNGLVSRCIISGNNNDGLYRQGGEVINCIVSGNLRYGFRQHSLRVD